MDWAEFLDAFIPSPDTVAVSVLPGGAGLGDTYADPVDVPGCVVQDGEKTVKVQTNGAAGEVRIKASCTVFMPPDTTCPVGSRVTLPSGRTAKAIAVETLTDNGIGLPEHLEVSLE